MKKEYKDLSMISAKKYVIKTIELEKEVISKYDNPRNNERYGLYYDERGKLDPKAIVSEIAAVYLHNLKGLNKKYNLEADYYQEVEERASEISTIASELYMEKKHSTTKRLDPLDETFEMIYVYDTCLEKLSEQYQFISRQDEQSNPFTM